MGHVSRPSRRAASRGMTGTRMGANRSSRCRIQGDARPGGEGHPGGTFGTHPRITTLWTAAKPFSWKHLERRTRPPAGHPPPVETISIPSCETDRPTSKHTEFPFEPKGGKPTGALLQIGAKRPPTVTRHFIGALRCCSAVSVTNSLA